jgi:quercetin dioxygenase-like cupin family protein
MTALAGLVTAMAEVFRRKGGAGGPGAAMAATVAARLDRLDAAAAKSAAPRGAVPSGIALDTIMAEAEAGPEGTLVRALRPVLPEVSWIQTYKEAEIGPDWIQRSGYFDVASPARGLVEAADVAAGFMVMGPGLVYPEHYHPAEELYFPLSGEAEWRYGDGAWQRHGAGALVFTPSMAAHAIRTHAATLFLMYAWIGDLATSARLGRP